MLVIAHCSRHSMIRNGSNPAEMQRWSEDARRRGETLAFVPTMGFLHEGHLTLMREGRARATRLASSLFVNPTQFGPAEDFASYPRDATADLAKLASVVLWLKAAGKLDRSGMASRQYGGSLFEQAVLLTLDAICHALWQASGVEASALWARHANIE